MEELRSTDVLDNEIRAESRKKAEQILARADESSLALIDGVDARVAEARESAEKLCEERLTLFRKNCNASVPLEKERYLVSYVHGSVIEAMNRYFESVAEDKHLAVIKGLVERSMSVIENREVEALVVGLDLAAAEKMLKEKLGKFLVSCSQGSEHLLEGEAVEGFKWRQGIILSAADKSFTCRLTLDQKIREILDGSSHELAAALFDGRIPE